MKKEPMKICRKCGLMIDIIETGLYRKTIVDDGTEPAYKPHRCPR